MIPLFPTLFDDELLYSGWSRFAVQMQYRHTSAVLDDLFGTSFMKVSMDLPGHIEAFVDRLPQPKAYTVDELIDGHTLLPLYRPFLRVERLEQIRQAMSSNGKGIHLRAGITASGVLAPSWLRFCPQCVHDDRRQWGTCYWHRTHQVTGVLVCPLHSCWLESTTIRFNQQRGKTLFVTAEQAVYSCSLRSLDPSNQNQQYLLQIAEDVAWLLQQREIQQNFESLRRQYDMLLFDKGLASYRGVTRGESLLEAFDSHYPPSFFALVGILFDVSDRRNWLTRLIADKTIAHHPLRHILLIRFLGYSAQTFFTQPREHTPFGSPPWICLNPACPHYHQPVIQTCQIVFGLNTKQGRPIGIFSCSCSYTYTRTGPDQSEKDRWRKTRIQSYGKIWEDALRAGWENSHMTVKELEHQLKTDTATVKRNAARLGLSFNRAAGSVALLLKAAPTSPTSGTPSREAHVQAHQAAWLEAVQSNPTAGVEALKQQYPQAYAALYRYTPQWLKEHTPKAARRFPSRAYTTSIDWAARDEQLVATIYQAAQAIKNAPGRPQRITTNSIFIKLGKRGLFKQLCRLPRTTEALAEVVESLEAFAIRRIFYVAQQCRIASSALTRARLLKLANAESFANRPAVESALYKALHSEI